MKNVNIPFVLALASLALVRPLMSMLGLLEAIGQPFGSISVTVFISILWIGIVVLSRVAHPVKTLLYTGITYGVYAILLSAILSPILEGQLQGPITNPFAIVSVLLTNALWGLVAGGIATLLQQALRVK
ncbi:MULTISPECIES: hypothetical protein [Paenibacillus]|jgi:hypothetical protein|uniref:Uncharacterized protein n=1 Tax=Paenibacillus barengoltzii J12 TaxID=935846 RepID=A0ABY1M148_9BACL|nr:MULTISPECIES: hypothetical protein [Paenibacillus]EES72388.1 hypothetical protein POTG_02996 [Paenibacillus sp. oral taxon 786 str. D14]SMF52793.1 hypothetical protein SAMN02744124_03479 [Paenibacillus barengoltzii J12]